MKNKNLVFSALLAASVGLVPSAVAQSKTQKAMTTNNSQVKKTDNPLFSKSPLQYQAPEFDKIKDEHFEPAFKAGISQQLNEIKAILVSAQPPSFENTILALENSGELLNRSRQIFGNLTSANTNPTLQKLEEEYAAVFAKHSDAIYLDADLYAKVKAVYDQRSSLKLDAESLRLVAYYKQLFEMAGANLSQAKKVELKSINENLASLQTAFSNKLLEARKNGALLVSDVEELAGLSKDDIAAAAQDAELAGHPGQYLLALQNTTQQPLLQYLKDRTTREKLFKAAWTRAEKGDENDTREILEQLANLRLQKANLLGKESFADWKLQDQMAQKREAALELLKQIAQPAVAKAKEETKDIQDFIDRQGDNFKLEPWDWNFYAEQVRQEKFDLDENQIRPYFEIQNVLEKGAFYAAEKLYGLTFKKRTDLPVYHPDVVTYEVFDQDGKSLALYYLDFYTRDNKNGGAWMNNFVDQSLLLGQKPVIVNVYNYQKPAAGKSTLLSFDDVTTVFHEFGHSLHGFFANQKYTTLSGTNVPRDFVEFPSQINEKWATEPSVLNNYALHYQTKKPIPQELVDKIKKAATFNEGYAVTELVAAAALDMSWHSVTHASQFTSALDFEKQALEKFGLRVNEVPPRYHTPYFAHIWGGGYSSGYYAYIWSEMLDFDAYEWFKANGGMTRENGNRFRKYILSVGNTVDLNKAFMDFTGKKPTINALLKERGLVN